MIWHRPSLKKLFGQGSEFESCAIEEIANARAYRTSIDKDVDNPIEADPERCLPLIKLSGGNEALKLLIDKELKEVLTSLDSINDALGDGFILKEGDIFSGAFLSDLYKCQAKSKDYIKEQIEISDQEIEKLTVLCAEKALQDVSKVITIDSLKQHPKLKEYQINLGANMRGKVANAVSVCMKEEFDNNTEKTFSSLSSGLERGQKRCMDIAIKMTLDPKVVETVVQKLLTEKLEQTDHEWVIPEAKKEIISFYRCFYRPPSRGSREKKIVIVFLREVSVIAHRIFLRV